MKRFLICLGSYAAAPAAVSGVDRAALAGRPDLAVACAVLATAAAATAAWITARVGMHGRRHERSYRGVRGHRFAGRNGGGW